MVFEPQNKLERSLMQAATDPLSHAQFYKDFVESDIFIIQDQMPAQKERTTTEQGTQLIICKVHINGKDYVPIFSSLPQLQAAWQKKTSYATLNALEFLKVVQGAPVFLNPGAEYAKEFTAGEIASIIDGTI